MDDDPLDPNLDFDIFDDDDCSHTTVLRATVARDGRVTMTHWRPFLAEKGPAGEHLRRRERAGIAIADLHLVRNADGRREVIVEFMAAGRARPAAEDALRHWAQNARHARIWFPGGPVELDPPPAFATATVVCPTCRARWVDATPNFWTEIAELGHFPLACPTCGNGLPQWDVLEGDRTGCRGAA